MNTASSSVTSRLATLLMVASVAGCVAADPRPARGALRSTTEIFGVSVESRPIRATILGDGPETYLLFGVIHGNEPHGATLLEQFIEHVRQNPRLVTGKRLVVAPIVNPDGFAHGTRRNSRGVDLNRNFPSRNFVPAPAHGPYPASEPETRAILKMIRQFQPTRILSVHSPLRVVNYDGEAATLATEISRACSYPVAPSIGYPTPGSLGSYTGTDWSVPTITLELGADVDDANVWTRFAGAVETFVTHHDSARYAEAGTPDPRTTKENET